MRLLRLSLLQIQMLLAISIWSCTPAQLSVSAQDTSAVTTTTKTTANVPVDVDVDVDVLLPPEIQEEDGDFTCCNCTGSNPTPKLDWIIALDQTPLTEHVIWTVLCVGVVLTTFLALLATVFLAEHLLILGRRRRQAKHISKSNVQAV